MNNISPTNKAQRLTEAEVHAAAEELQETGGKVSSIELYRHLGRGSLTTITNFMKSWRPGEEEKNTLPALISLPESIKATSEQLIIKLWAESQKLAEAELQSQREALRQAEALASEKIEEAQAFSNEQEKKIDDLKVQIEILREEAGKAHDYFLLEEKNLRHDLDNSRKNATIFEERFLEKEKQMNVKIEENIELKEKIKRLETEKQKEVDTARQEERRLEGEISKLKVSEAALNEKVISLTTKCEKLEGNNKLILKLKDDQAKLLMGENKELSKQRDEAIKKAAILEGNLEIWKKINLPEEMPRDNDKKEEIKSRKKKKSELIFKQVDIKEIAPLLDEILPVS